MPSKTSGDFERLTTDEDRAAWLYSRIRAARRREAWLWTKATPEVVELLTAMGLTLSRDEPAPPPGGFFEGLQ